MASPRSAAVTSVQPTVAAEVEAASEGPSPAPEHARASSMREQTIVAAGVQPGLAAFAERWRSGGFLWAGKMQGNGGREVVVYVPPGARRDADFQLVFHFHGTYSEHIEERSPGAEKRRWVGLHRLQQTVEGAADLQRERPFNVALVYPLSAGRRLEPGCRACRNKQYDRMWMNPEGTDSFDALYREVVSLLEGTYGVAPGRLDMPAIVEGHSAGGIALMHVARSHPERVGEYLFLDSGFQDWADGCYAALQEFHNAAKITLVITDRGIADPFGHRDPWCERLEKLAVEWPRLKTACRDRPQRKPAGYDRSCADLQEAAESWPDYAWWCAAMKNDMKDVAQIQVHRTKIPHGLQPRHFVGGLSLPSRGGAR